MKSINIKQIVLLTCFINFQLSCNFQIYAQTNFGSQETICKSSASGANSVYAIDIVELNPYGIALK